MKIRTMSENDISAVVRLEQEAFSDPWSEQSFRDSLKMESALFLVAEEENEIAGYAGMYLILDEGDITNIAVFQKWKRRGVGTKLLNELLAEAKRRGAAAVTLEVRKGNTPAIALYEKTGFVPAGVRKNFYDHPKEDALIMWNEKL